MGNNILFEEYVKLASAGHFFKITNKTIEGSFFSPLRARIKLFFI